MKRMLYVLLPPLLFLAGCNGREVLPELPNIKVASELPAFTDEKNEIEIADSFTSADPTMVLGALVNLENGEVRSFDSCLKEGTAVEKTAVAELAFKDFLENSVVADAEWLTFLEGHVSSSIRAEVTVTEAAKALIALSDVDEEKLQKLARTVPAENRERYNVIVGYRDFVISASLFKAQEIDASVSGYGAKIGGKWYGEQKHTSTDHRVIAMCSPLPFVIDRAGSADSTIRAVPLTTLTLEAMESDRLRIRPLDAPRRSFRLRRTP